MTPSSRIRSIACRVIALLMLPKRLKLLAPPECAPFSSASAPPLWRLEAGSSGLPPAQLLAHDVSAELDQYSVGVARTGAVGHVLAMFQCNGDGPALRQPRSRQ